MKTNLNEIAIDRQVYDSLFRSSSSSSRERPCDKKVKKRPGHHLLDSCINATQDFLRRHGSPYVFLFRQFLK